MNSWHRLFVKSSSTCSLRSRSSSSLGKKDDERMFYLSESTESPVCGLRFVDEEAARKNRPIVNQFNLASLDVVRVLLVRPSIFPSAAVSSR